MGVEGKIKAENSPGGRDFIKMIGSLGRKFDCALTLLQWCFSLVTSSGQTPLSLYL